MSEEISMKPIGVVESCFGEKFSAWVAKEFQGGGQPLEVPKPLLEVIDEYAKDGFK